MKPGQHVRESPNVRRDVVAFFMVRVGRAVLPLQLRSDRSGPVRSIDGCAILREPVHDPKTETEAELENSKIIIGYQLLEHRGAAVLGHLASVQVRVSF